MSTITYRRSIFGCRRLSASCATAGSGIKSGSFEAFFVPKPSQHDGQCGDASKVASLTAPADAFAPIVDAENDAEAVLDRLAYILSLAEAPTASMDLLHRVFDFVGSPTARLCLRARGALPHLLAVLQVVRLRAIGPLGLGGSGPQTIAIGVLQRLSLDAACHGPLLIAALEELLEAASTPAMPQPSQVPCVQSSPIKRRRKEELVHACDVIYLVTEPLPLRLASPADMGSVALLVLRRCLQGSHRGTEPEGHAISARIFQSVLPLLFAEAQSWERTPGVRQAENDSPDQNTAVRMLLLLDVLTACVDRGAELPSDIWGAVVGLSAGILSMLLDATYTYDSLAPPLLGDISHAVLRLLYSATQRDSSVVRFTVAPLSTDSSCKPLPDKPDSLLELLAWVLVLHPSDHITFSTQARLALGVMANVASHGPVSRHAVAALPVPSVFAAQLLSGALVIPSSRLLLDGRARQIMITKTTKAAATSKTANVTAPTGMSTGASIMTTFLEAMVEAFAERSAQLFPVGDCQDMPVPSAEVAEARVNCAMTALVLGWLISGAEVPTREEATRRLGGSLDPLLDILRQFAVFQDCCGILTEASLLGLHAVMLLVGALGGSAEQCALATASANQNTGQCAQHSTLDVTRLTASSIRGDRPQSSLAYTRRR